MTIMPCMMDRLQGAPRSVTPHGHRPRVEGPTTPGAPPPARPRAPVAIYPHRPPRAVGLFGACCGVTEGYGHRYPSLRGRRPLLLSTRTTGRLAGLLCLRKAEGAKTMPRGGRRRGNGRGVRRPPLPLALPHGSARSATTRMRAAREGREKRDLSHNERPWGLTTHGAPCQRRAVRH
jgi:hypothetical protein